MVLGSSGSRGRQGSVGSRIGFFLRAARGDHQWLLSAVLLMLVVVAGVLIDSARNLLGVSTTDALAANEIIHDAAWNADGNLAMFVAETAQGQQQRRWDGTSTTVIDVSPNEPWAIDWYVSGWMIGSADGWLGTCEGGCGSVSTRAAVWDGNASQVDRVTVITAASEAPILTLETTGAPEAMSGAQTGVRTVSGGTVSTATFPVVETHRLLDIELVSPVRAIAAGVDDALATPTQGTAGTVIVEVSEWHHGQPAGAAHTARSSGGRAHTVVAVSGGEDGRAIMAGVAGAHRVDARASMSPWSRATPTLQRPPSTRMGPCGSRSLPMALTSSRCSTLTVSCLSGGCSHPIRASSPPWRPQVGTRFFSMEMMDLAPSRHRCRSMSVSAACSPHSASTVSSSSSACPSS